MGKETSKTGTGEPVHPHSKAMQEASSPKQGMFSNDNSDSKHGSHIQLKKSPNFFGGSGFSSQQQFKAKTFCSPVNQPFIH